MPLTATIVSQAQEHLRNNDPVMRQMMETVGDFTLRPQQNRFGMLVRSIISQQISVGAARSIRAKLEQLVGPDKISPDNLLRFEAEDLRPAGLSSQKATYILDLAAKAQDGTIQLQTIGRRSDDQVIAELTQVKGIGKWTAQMFLIFALGRPDVFPHDDLGIRAAIKRHYALPDLPDKQTSLEVAEAWHPYATVASWYCWRSLDVLRTSEQAKE